MGVRAAIGGDLHDAASRSEPVAAITEPDSWSSRSATGRSTPDGDTMNYVGITLGPDLEQEIMADDEEEEIPNLCDQNNQSGPLNLIVPLTNTSPIMQTGPTDGRRPISPIPLQQQIQALQLSHVRINDLQTVPVRLLTIHGRSQGSRRCIVWNTPRKSTIATRALIEANLQLVSKAGSSQGDPGASSSSSSPASASRTLTENQLQAITWAVEEQMPCSRAMDRKRKRELQEDLRVVAFAKKPRSILEEETEVGEVVAQFPEIDLYEGVSQGHEAVGLAR